MINTTNNQTYISRYQGTSDIFAQFKNNVRSNDFMNPVSSNTNTNILQNLQNSLPKVEVQPKTNTVEQDTFEKEVKKKDKKKIAKYVAIGTGVATLAYSAFALIKYKHAGGSKKILPRLAEPIKVLSARINPNGFKPSVAIEEDEISFIYEVTSHICRLKNPERQQKFAQHLLETLNFTEEGRQKFIRIFGDLLNQQ